MFCDHTVQKNFGELKSFVNYTNQRENGRIAYHEHQRVSDKLTAQRSANALIADTPVNCRSVYLLRLNCSGRLVAAAHGDRSVCIYCSSTGRLLLKCIGHEKSPWTLTFHSTQPHLLASGCLGGNVRLWNLDCLAVLDDEKVDHIVEISSVCVWKHGGAVSSLAFHPVHPILVAAWTQEMVFYDWVSGRMLSTWRFVSNHSRVRWVKFSPDGTILYTATVNPSNIESAYVYKSPDQSVVNSPTKVESNENLGQPLYSSMDHGSVSAMTKTSGDCAVPRDALLEYLVNCPDSWFQNLGICSVCTVRLCRWAGTLGPKFPAITTDIRLGMSVAQRAAASVTTYVKSSHVQHLLDLANANNRSEVCERLCRDTNPAAVAIIEDMPVHEFLLSRGDYCQSPRVAISNNGICCGGHARDLVITHRELMRHSLCRPCLSSFWCWASRNVAWWCWSLPTSDEQSPDLLSDDVTKTVSVQSTVSFTEPNITLKPSDVEPPVGICIQCKAKMSLQLQSPPNMSPTYTESPILSCKVGSESSKFKESNLTSFNEKPSKSLSLMPLAALDLLRSRLSNAHEVTPVTYVAMDLINDIVFSQHIKNLLVADGDLDLNVPHNPLNSITYNRVEEANVCASSSAKRRKVDHQSELLSGHCSSEPSNNITSVSRPLLMDFDANCEPLESNLPSTFSAPKYRLPQEASDLGAYTRDNPDNNWNYPRPVTVHHTSSVIPCISSSIFPYVQTGASLLRSPRQLTDSSAEPAFENHVPEMAALSETLINDTTIDSYETDPYEASDRSSMTACCRCGRIVLQTFPVDPHSDISAVVCEKLVYSENHYLTTGSFKTQDGIMHSQYSSDSYTHTNINHFSHQSNLTPSNSSPPESVCFSNRFKKSEHTEGSVNSLLHLVDQTGSNSILNSVNRSITEVITGLFVDMGEYGSASSLQDVTHRICRWELSLCSPIYNSPHASTSPDECDSTNNTCLPMPTNVAVSYNSNSLVVPHARLFNDSSVCLSSDGRLLAAFVTPRETSCYSSQPQSSLGTLLAVYRLQPDHIRGQCLFARRFTAASPVCVDFSPLGDFLAVGLATTRIPSEPFSVTRSSTQDGFIRFGSSLSLSDHTYFRQPNIKCSCQRQSSVGKYLTVVTFFCCVHQKIYSV
ncbi:Activating molecule in BECN1-regulated autophagy protein 1 [Schistosoma japonicum]|nr:Activating molecule in BECN1-regulated autophagy protein 1 [Schistosoma japonicum]